VTQHGSEPPTFIDHESLGRLEVLDDRDPSLLTVRHKSGETFRIGKAAVGWGKQDAEKGTFGDRPVDDVADPSPFVTEETASEQRTTQPAPELPTRSLDRAAPSAVPAVSEDRVAEAAAKPKVKENLRRHSMEAKVIEFKFEKETKNTVRYEEVTEGQPPAVGTLYVQKWALGTPAPGRLKMTLEVSEQVLV